MSSSLSPSRLPDIRYSQNFLRDPCLVASLLDVCQLAPDSLVYEIGPGKGIITGQLALRYQRVVAVEKDPCLAARLRERFADRPNVTIYHDDFLRFSLPREPYHVVANTPFTITSAIVAKLTVGGCMPESAHLIMQREAADTLLGRPHESLRTILLKPWFEAEPLHHFRRTDFTPAPRVDVVMLRLRKRGPPLVPPADRQYFRDFAVHVFTAWQPTVEQTLKRLCGRRQLDAIRRRLDFDLAIIPTDMTIERWLKLFASFQTITGEHGRAAVAGSEKRLAQQQSMLEKTHRTRVRR